QAAARPARPAPRALRPGGAGTRASPVRSHSPPSAPRRPIGWVRVCRLPPAGAGQEKVKFRPAGYASNVIVVAGERSYATLRGMREDSVAITMNGAYFNLLDDDGGRKLALANIPGSVTTDYILFNLNVADGKSADINYGWSGPGLASGGSATAAVGQL